MKVWGMMTWGMTPITFKCITYNIIVYLVYMQRWIPYQLVLTIGVFMIAFGGLVYMKPLLVYTEEGSPRVFGIGTQKKTILPVWLCVLLLSIFSYISVHYILHYQNQY